MELNHLKYFYEVARAGSFTEASKTLRVSQPSISKLVKLLEEEQGVKLFDRTKKGAILTTDGKLFFDSCQRIFSEIEGLTTSLLQREEECAGELRIGASDNICNYIFPKLLSEFGKKYPKVLVKLMSGAAQQIVTELGAGQIEAGIFYTPVSDKRTFEATKIWQVEFVPVCSADNKILRECGFSSRALDKVGFVGSRQTDYNKPYPALKMLRSNGFSPQVVFETNNQETQKRMVLANYGYTLVPRHMVEAELQSGVLKLIKWPRKLIADVYFVKRRNRSISRQGQIFLEHLKEFKLKNL